MYILDENKLPNGDSGYCTCAKCGNNFARVNLRVSRVIATIPPINEYDYTCPECGHHGCVDEDSIFYLSDKAYKKINDKDDDYENKSKKDKSIEVKETPLEEPEPAIKKLVEPSKENEFLLTMNIRNLKTIVDSYLDEVDRLYSKVNHVIEEKPINQDLLKTLDERIGVVKKELLDVIEKHVRCNCNGKNCPTISNVKEGGCTFDIALKEAIIRATPYNMSGWAGLIPTKDKDK